MIQLLLVDDEPIILRNMADNDWAGIGIEGVYTAMSGLDAVKILQSTAIDIVVTDIRMPGMDGLELCKYIHEHHPHTKCILLSGYGEFEYAKKAIEYKTVNYLLKPIRDEELMEEVARVKQLLEQEWERISSLEQARKTLRTHLPLLKANLLKDLLSGVPISDAALQEKLGEYNLPFRMETPCSLLLVRIDETKSAISDPTLYEFAIQNIAGEILENRHEVWHCKDDYGYLCFLIQERLERDAATQADRSLKKLAQDLILKVSGYLRGEISVLISGTHLFPQGLVEQYRESLNALRKIPRSESGLVVHAKESRTQSRSLDSLYSPPSFQQLLEAGRWQDARMKLADLLAEMRDKRLDTAEHVIEVVYTLLNAFLYIAHLQGKTLMETIGFEANIMAEQGILGGMDEFAKWAETALDNLEASSEEEFHDNKNQLISRVQRFIEDHIAGDVSLQAIADYVDLHPAYLSSLYKQETGENISDYIMRYRMEKAGLLLRTTDIKIYELSARLGFQNPPYFSKLFKVYYGVTPQDYRERNQTES